MKFVLGIEISNLNYPGIQVYVALHSHIDGLNGYNSLQMTSEVTSDLTFELSDLNYSCYHASLASKRLYGLNDRTLIMTPTYYVHYALARKKHQTSLKISMSRQN